MQRFTLQEMAAHLRYRSAKAFAAAVREHGIPHIPLGRRMIFDPAAVEAFLIAKRERLATSNVVRMPVKRKKQNSGRLSARLGI